MIGHKLTINLKKAFVLAKMQAGKEGGGHKITTVQLLSALFNQRGCLAWKVLHYEIFTKAKRQIPLLQKTQTASNLSAQRAVASFRLNDFPLTKTAQIVIAKAIALARQGQHYFVGTEHLLAAIVKIRKGQAYLFLKRNKIDLQAMEKHLDMLLENASRFSQLMQPFEKTGGRKRAKKVPFLQFFSRDLNAKARAGEIDPVIGREQEIQRIINILGRRTKNNPLLIGDAGVGKTAIAEGLAYKIVRGEVPPLLQNKRILLLDLTSLVAGTMFRGEFESRLKKILQAIENDPNIILFIDELHTVIGTGGAMGSLDTANILKPALARGKLRCIGATTLAEYQKYIEKDRALERRFQPVIVREPSMEETITVLKGIRENYERFHGIKITDNAIEKAVKLSVRYLPDRLLPDKAIDLIDEAASRQKIQCKESKTAHRFRKLEQKLRETRQAKIEMVKRELYQKASVFKKMELDLQKEIVKLQKRLAPLHQTWKGQIAGFEIKRVVSEMTQIPLSALTLSEKSGLLRLEKHLRSKVINQDEAINSIARCIRRNRAGITNPNRPLGSFIFLGPSGVGKTYLAQILAEQVFGSRQNLVRIDMSEFREHFNVSRLVGAPAGYVGYEEGGKLTEKIRHQPYSVVLFDEIEKAHPEALNLLLQILEDGQLTDAQGRSVNFKNTIIIMTSNLGTNRLVSKRDWGFREKFARGQSRPQENEGSLREMKREVLKEIEEKFPPEFINRVDKIIVFNPLEVSDLEKIVKLNIDELNARLHEQKIILTLDPRVARHLARKAYSRFQGARPLRRLVADQIEDPLASLVLAEKTRPGDYFAIKLQKNKIVFWKKRVARSQKMEREPV